MRTHKKIAVFLAIGVCIGLVIWFAYSGPATRASQEKSRRPALSVMPEIESCVQHIKLIRGELKNLSDGTQVAVLELENQAYVGVIAISVETMVEEAKHEVVRSGFTPDKEPLIIIPPHKKANIEIGNLSANSHIRIGSVMFSDGTEEGCESSLKTIRTVKEHDTKKAGQE